MVVCLCVLTLVDWRPAQGLPCCSPESQHVYACPQFIRNTHTLANSCGYLISQSCDDSAMHKIIQVKRLQLMFRSNIKMKNMCDLWDFNHGKGWCQTCWSERTIEGLQAATPVCSDGKNKVTQRTTLYKQITQTGQVKTGNGSGDFFPILKVSGLGKPVSMMASESCSRLTEVEGIHHKV